MIIPVNAGLRDYDIIIEAGCTDKAGELLNLNRKVLVVTDSGVPKQYAEKIAKCAKVGITECVKQGEGSKSIAVWERLLKIMLDNGFSRKDCVVAVGGGVVGDLSAFAASSYMRGIDFYNIPTTVLSQVDSSIGGKTGVNFEGIKNIVGSFYPPMRVLIDPLLLKTLPKRQISNGLAESVKMALTSDAELFSILEDGVDETNITTVIEKSIKIKKYVVETDEKEQGLRKILNFGHTIAHGIESFEHLNGLYHGECVALGMIPMCSSQVRSRLLKVLKMLDLPTRCDIDPDEVFDAMTHDKKADNSSITYTTVNEVGKFTIQSGEISLFREKLDYFLKGDK